MGNPLTSIVAMAVTAFISACAGSAPAKPSDFVHERIVSVVATGDAAGEVVFELSQRRFVIDPVASPDAKAMLTFAQEAKIAGKPVHATVAPSGQRTKGDDGPPFVLVRLADTPDPAAGGAR